MRIRFALERLHTRAGIIDGTPRRAMARAHRVTANITGSRSNGLDGNFRGLSGHFSCAESETGLQRITEANCVSLPPDRSEVAYGPPIQ